MKFLFTVNLLLLTSFLSYTQTKKILIVATNVNSFGATGNGSLSWEIAYPFQYFIDNGYEVDIATPKGGKVALYDLMVPNDLKKILQSELFLSKTKNSLAPGQVKDSAYNAVFYPGGYGQFFDVVNDARIANLVAKIYENGGVIGTTGHGAASLINIKLSNAKYLVDGKTITCFPWSAELKMSISNYGMSTPFNMEQVLTKRGANLIVCPNGPKPTKDCTCIIDDKNRMVTGAYAGNAQWVAEEMIKLLQKL